jgi:hypothetical protein
VKDLDRRLTALGRVDIDHNLSGLEKDVWVRADAKRRAALAPLPKQIALAACAFIAATASIAGLEVGAAQAAAAPAPVFDLHNPLAPSTALDK